jgi:hypothetical protein
MLIRLTTLPMALFAVMTSSAVGAEQERVDGMGRTRGWVVASEAEGLGFVDCQGRHLPLGSARVESSSQRCPTSPTLFVLAGVVRSVDVVRRVVHAEDGAGRLQAFHVPAGVVTFDDLHAGDRIEVSGPIDGQATTIVRR